MAQTIRDIMTTDVLTLAQDSTVREAAEAMRKGDVGDVIVLDDRQQVAGIVTDRDIVIRGIAEGRDPSATPLKEVGSGNVATLGPEEDVGAAVRLVRERAVRRIPIVENGRPVGIVSIGDLAIERDSESALADISAKEPNK